MIALAVLVVLVVLLIWRLQNVEGDWQVLHGRIPTGTGVRVLRGGHDVEVTVGDATDQKMARVLFPGRKHSRLLCIRGRCGILTLSGRHINWGGGVRWARQGLL